MTVKDNLLYPTENLDWKYFQTTHPWFLFPLCTWPKGTPKFMKMTSWECYLYLTNTTWAKEPMPASIHEALESHLNLFHHDCAITFMLNFFV